MAHKGREMKRFLMLISVILSLLIIIIIAFTTTDAINTLNKSRQKAEDQVIQEVVGLGTLSSDQLLPGGSGNSAATQYLSLAPFMAYAAGDPSGVYGFLLNFLGPIYGVMGGTISADGQVLASSLPEGINANDVPAASGDANHYQVVDHLGSQQGHFIVWYIPWVAPIPGTNQMPTLAWIIDRTNQINGINSDYSKDRTSLLVRQLSIGAGALILSLIIVLLGVWLLSRKYIIDPMTRMQEQLLRAERLSALGEMAGSMGHEMRNPLNVIKTSAFYLKSKLNGADKKLLDHLDRVDRGVERADNIITDLLSYSRITTVAPKETDMKRLAETVLSEMAVPAGVAVTIQAPDGLPHFWTDPGQFSQVLHNLLLNSFQAMPEGGEVEVALAEEDGAFEATVRDTGEGISEENLPKVFEPLFSTKAVGTGFGLAVCRRIVEERGGTIAIESEEGKGTQVTVKLPSEGRE